MDNLQNIEKWYQKFREDLTLWLPEGLVQVDIDLLKELQLLDFQSSKGDANFTRYFQVAESDEKITLVNDQFIVWIAPEKVQDETFTYVFIAINHLETPHLEVAFAVNGVYNTSKLVLRLLESYLLDIQENEESLKSLKLV